MKEELLKIAASPCTEELIEELSTKTLKKIDSIEDEEWEIITTDNIRYTLKAIGGEMEEGYGCISLLSLSRDATPEEIKQYKETMESRRGLFNRVAKRCKEKTISERAMARCVREQIGEMREGE